MVHKVQRRSNTTAQTINRPSVNNLSSFLLPSYRITTLIMHPGFSVVPLPKALNDEILNPRLRPSETGS